MTAPRKPVAYRKQVISREHGPYWSLHHVDDAEHAIATGCKGFEPLYTAPDLKPLWALVDYFEETRDSIYAHSPNVEAGDAFDLCARELRKGLEAMQ